MQGTGQEGTALGGLRPPPIPLTLMERMLRDPVQSHKPQPRADLRKGSAYGGDRVDRAPVASSLGLLRDGWEGRIWSTEQPHPVCCVTRRDPHKVGTTGCGSFCLLHM